MPFLYAWYGPIAYHHVPAFGEPSKNVYEVELLFAIPPQLSPVHELLTAEYPEIVVPDVGFEVCFHLLYWVPNSSYFSKNSNWDEVFALKVSNCPKILYFCAVLTDFASVSFANNVVPPWLLWYSTSAHVAPASVFTGTQPPNVYPVFVGAVAATVEPNVLVYVATDVELLNFPPFGSIFIV